MKILYVLDSPYAFNNGCWFYRNRIPLRALQKKGHTVNFIALNSGRGLQQETIDFPDVAVFSRTYPIDPLMTLRAFKQAGKKVAYDTDDDLWSVNPDNPSASVSTEKQRQYEHLMAECDVVTTTTPELAKILKKFNKNVHVCPNAVDYDLFLEAPRPKLPKDILRIGYTGAASHWKDLSLIADVLLELQKKHKFEFILQGMCGQPLEVEMWQYKQVLDFGLQPEKKLFLESALSWYRKMEKVKFMHIPFYPPIMYPALLKSADLDIGIAPLNDNKFNHSKSCVKFYEYASVGAATLASDVLPYSKEVGYCCKNNVNDWVKKLEKLIVDEKFRKELAAKQAKWVKENRDIKTIVTKWEDAFDVV